MKSDTQPIFIHSLWRAGSTYLFQVFRRADGRYWAYQEPVHEAALRAKNNPKHLAIYSPEEARALRHPPLQQGYFYELQKTHAAWHEKIKKDLIYENYFTNAKNQSLLAYYQALILAAPARPALQDCRTSARISTIKNVLGGVHIYLWRNPWDQWWSFQINDYFPAVLQVILSADSPPPVIQEIKKEIGFQSFRADQIEEEISHFIAHPLDSKKSYLVFYAIWATSLLEGLKSADIIINIDKLSNSLTYKERTKTRLAKNGINGLNITDCSIPISWYSQEDIEFFEPIEEQVHQLLISDNQSGIPVTRLLSLRKQFTPKPRLSIIGLQESLRRARAIARRKIISVTR